MNLKNHFKRELQLFEGLTPMMIQAVLALRDILINEAPSGGAAPYYAAAIANSFRDQSVVVDFTETDTHLREARLCWLDFFPTEAERNEIARVFVRLCGYLPLTPLTGLENEWREVSAGVPGESMRQNSRCPAVLTNGRRDEAFWTGGVVFEEPNKTRFISPTASSVPVSFPFMPSDPIVVKLDENGVAVDPDLRIHSDRLNGTGEFAK